jgi:hypothetical protein
MLNATKVYTLPPELSGSPLVAGATHVDVVSFHRDSFMRYIAEIRAGIVEQVPDVTWTAPLIPDPAWEDPEDGSTAPLIPDPAWEDPEDGSTAPLIPDPAWEDPEDGSTAPLIPDPAAVRPDVDSFKAVKIFGEPFRRVLQLEDRDGFEAWVSGNPDYGTSDPDGHPSYTEGAVLIWLMTQWVTSQTT